MKTTNLYRAVFNSETKITAPPAEVFPLLCPVREYDWIDGWECEVVYSESGVAENNCIFTTNVPERGGEAVWTVTRYEPENCLIQFCVLYPGKFVEKIDIHGEEIENGTSLMWHRTYTALNETGKEILETTVAPHTDMMMNFIEASLNHYCQHGTMLTRVSFLRKTDEK